MRLLDRYFVSSEMRLSVDVYFGILLTVGNSINSNYNVNSFYRNS